MARLLLADDDRIARDFVTRALETDGHVVVVADDGQEALSKLQSDSPFDALITDVQMPGVDGIALSQKALAANGRLRVVMMSGYPDMLDQARRTLPGQVQFLTKPFAIDAIRAAVAAALKI